MEQNLNQNPAPIQPESSKKNPTWAIVLISILATGVVVASGTYYFLNKDKVNNEPAVTNQPTVNPSPTTSQNGNLLSEGFVYMKSLNDSNTFQGEADIIVSNFDGSSKLKIQTIPHYISPMDDNDVSQNGKVVYSTIEEKEESIWVSDNGSEPRKIFTSPQNKYIESTIISLDGQKIAYSLLNWSGGNSTEQLWTINADGSENKLVIDDTGRFIAEQGPFRLAPIAWSKDNSKIYLHTTTDSEATPRGLYVADPATAKIQKAKTPNITLWGLAFSPDRTKIAYTTFEWKYVPDSFPESGSPFTISITDLNTGVTEKVLESQTDHYSNSVWSPDSKKLLYKVERKFVEGGDAGIFIVDIGSKKTSIVVPSTKNTRMRPWAWLSNERIVYTEETYTSGQIQNKVTTYLFTVKTDGTDKQRVDSSRELMVFDSIR